MIISLNPTYYCNFRCSFCYLGDMLSDKTTISLDRLNELLTELTTNNEPIDGIELYGGEITQLPDNYVADMFDVIRLHYDGPINIITNMSRIPTYFDRDDVTITVSWDYKAREQWQKVYTNMQTFNRQIDVLILASKHILKHPVQDIINMINALPNVSSVEIKPYSSNQYNQHSVSFKDFEEFVKSFITADNPLTSELRNETMIVESLNNLKNAFSDDHVYITPNGKFGVLEFDDNDNEFFLELNNYQEYIDWTNKEKLSVHMNGYCSSCEYLGNCLSEHLREVKDISQSCNGFKDLLDWYKANRKYRVYGK